MSWWLKTLCLSVSLKRFLFLILKKKENQYLELLAFAFKTGSIIIHLFLHTREFTGL